MTGDGLTADGGPQTPDNNVVVVLRNLQEEDLDIFFAQQRDPAGVYMAAFTTPNPDDRREFDELWDSLQRDQSVLIKTILTAGQVAGHILNHKWFGPLEVSYWLGREYWDRGIMTAALKAFLEIQTTRPIHARVAHDNIGSLRVLEKCGFVRTGRNYIYAYGRKEVTAGIIMKLE